LIPLTIPAFTKDMEEAAINTLNNDMLVGGESVHEFEDEFARHIGTDYALAVNSGSSALLLTFHSLGIKPRDKVVAPSATFVATINGPSILGGIPVFCEIGDDYVMSLKSLEQAIKRNVDAKYIIPVHLYGHPCDMDPIKHLAQKKDIVIVEDAAQAHGAKYKGKRVGSIGEAAIFSFYPTKNMTVCGDGGMITTNNKKIYETVMKMRDVGRLTKYTHDKIGYTLRLNSVNAAIGKVQLKYLDEWNQKRRTLAKRYHDKLNGIRDLILPPESNNNNESVYHMYVIKTEKRNALGAWLSMNEISTSVHYPIPVHRQPVYEGFHNNVDLNFTDEWSNTVLSIPMFPRLDHKAQDYVISKIQQFYYERVYEIEKVKNEQLAWSAKLI
jgi:perosamine synthetase